MNTCICREASKCGDYPVDLGCLFLGEAVLGINPKLGRIVSAEEALDHVTRCRARCREAGLVHMIGRNKLDSVWLNTRPGGKLLTICNCCPCCCLWRILPYITPKISSRLTMMPGVSVAVTDKCVGCGACTDGICFVNAIRLEDSRAVKTDACRGCGRCVDVCPNGAIELKIENLNYIENSIKRISRVVDVS
ncbi:MAG: 4Fe-4S dicluster domain-containing protein [Deltaproteobacteria bacterium]|nr:4Fe-4S dicluster domain-containing protein [Deltaproteobacteria bacterium]